jgi:hypothetical protein
MIKIDKKVQPDSKLIFGSIDGCENFKVMGWIYSPIDIINPVLTQNGIPLRCLRSNIIRDDVSKNLGTSDKEVGFEFELSSLNEDDEISLYGSTKNDLQLISSVCFKITIPETNFFNQLQKAVEVSKKNNSIAITCWDSNHNPLGRAKVLYEILKDNIEPILFSYSNKEFGPTIWRPLINSNINHVQIPWHNRAKYEHYIKESSLSFDTIWICKNRYPSLMLAKLVSHSKTSLILDIDDMEKEFSQSDAVKHKYYGRLTNNISNYYTNLITAKTSPSISLSNYFSSNIIRHTRYPMVNENISEINEKKFKIDIVFIGTVRNHKNIIGLAKKINEINKTANNKFTLHIYGDLPDDNRRLLDSLGSKTYKIVQSNKVQRIISNFDVCISGYPTANSEINKYQISSKIGDALSAKKPILVPYSESVKDLDNVNGIYLFNENNLEETLNKIVSTDKSINLPDQFNTLKNYISFEAVRKLSYESARADIVFNEHKKKSSVAEIKDVENILLFWKQNDSGIYGRRIDILARDLKKINPNLNVFIIEIRNKNDNELIIKGKDSYISDFKYITEDLSNKTNSYHVLDGVNYATIIFDTLKDLETNLDQFFLMNNINQSNTSLVLFPHIQNLETIMKVIKNFKIIVDVVDNQLEWAADNNKHTILAQLTTLFNIAETIVFNSEINFNYFKQNGFIDNSKEVQIVSNWYNLPPSFSPSPVQKIDEKTVIKNIFYSGNLKERFDWTLLIKIALKYPGINIHLIGASSNTNKALDSINQFKNIIYHGPLKEKENLNLISSMDFAIMPHLSDNISKYMNPLKVLMYKKLGIKTIASRVPGINEDDYLIIVDTHEEFIKQIQNNMKRDHSKNDDDYTNVSVYEKLLK